MVTRPISDFSGFSGRRARFEHDRPDAETARELLERLLQRTQQEKLVSTTDLRQRLLQAGIDLDMPRLADARGFLASDVTLDTAALETAPTPDISRFLLQIMDGDLAIQNFPIFENRIANIYAYAQAIPGGAVANYIPELAKQDPNAFGLAVCSIDGQRMALGEADTPFCLQSVVKPLNYALALGLNGERYVHHHVGREPSGLGFNELTLNRDNRPHNPMINSGAIMCSAMIRPGRPVDERFDMLMRFWDSAIGSQACSFDAAVYASEQATAERNYALARLMQSHGVFPEGSIVERALDLYFRSCAISLDCRALSVAAATLANGGVCPLTGHRIAEPAIIRNTLSLMLTCGMYDFSGEFAFVVGLPAKSGVSGGLMLVVPGVCGIGLWSPPLDRLGNTVRGLEFSRRLVEAFPFHIFAGTTGELR
ncbi:glutaminase A [uncultured Maricaulis sp.]|uniref:glutaminase A n=1 Tax=uncultured Maricaulis sp. TaxID=174710 RepID=UPI0030D8AFA8|tara:strand:+ start:17113 stop:18387 length:1275 start_codon:yes stop_codon:yes gene_type:complete